MTESMKQVHPTPQTLHSRPPRRRLWQTLALAVGCGLAPIPTTLASGAGDDSTVLILDTTVSGGAGSREAQAAVLAGMSVEVVTAAGWAAKTTAEFATYRALVLGDATCGGSAAAAEANNAVWGPVVDGNVILIGTDNVYHYSQGGQALVEKGMAFAVDQVGKTGAYITLSCYYHATAPFTPVPLLDPFGTFTVTGVGCYNDAHIVATHPALTGLTDATLSGWGCSVHEAFDSWPLTFQVLAIARGIGASYTAPDGSVGTPYILARGVRVISDIALTPETAVNPVGTDHTVTATVTTDDPVAGTPVVGATVVFQVIAGPNIGANGVGVTDGSGQATFTYNGAGGVGLDFIQATFVDADGNTQTSNLAEKEWVEVPCELVCPENVRVCNDPGHCGAVVEFPDPDVQGGCVGLGLVCTPPSGSFFGPGVTPVVCEAIDASGTVIAACTFIVEVVDCEAPGVECVPTVNPAGKKIPTAGQNPKSGQNPDGFYELRAWDNCDGANLAIWVKDSAEGPCGGAFAAGPFAPGDKVKLTQSPGHASVKPMAGVILAHVNTRGEPVLVVTDSSGNQACHQCFVPPLPK